MPFLEVRGKTLFYARVDGKEQAKGPNPVLVLIHGLGSSHTFYIPVMHQLAESGYTSVALDVYGSAQSQLVTGVEAPTFETIVDDIIGLLQGLDIPSDNIVAVGHSMGGIVVPMLASICRLQGAVLLGPVLPRAALADIFNARIETVKKDGMEPMAQTIPFAATGSKATLLQKAFIRTLLLSQKPEGYNALCGAIAKAEVPSYSTISSPVLVLAGEEDKTSPVADAQKIFDDWGCDASAKTMQVLPGVGHWHCIEAADAIAVGIEKFVSKLP